MAPGRSSTLTPARPCPLGCPLGRPHPSLLVKGAARTRSTALPHSWAAALRSGEEGWRTVVRPLRCVRGRCRAQRRGRAGHAPTPTAHPHPNILARCIDVTAPHSSAVRIVLHTSASHRLPSPLHTSPSSPPPLLPSSPPPLLLYPHPPLSPPPPPPLPHPLSTLTSPLPSPTFSLSPSSVSSLPGLP